MKKFFLLISALLYSFVMIACETKTTTQTIQTTTTQSEPLSTTLPMLATPENFTIIDNCVQFDLVDGATKYRLSVYDTEDTFIRAFNVTQGFNLLLMLEEGTYRFKLASTSLITTDSPQTNYFEYTITDPNHIGLLEGEAMNDFRYVRWIGRNYYHATTETHQFYFTASGFEVGFYGTEVKAVIQANNYNVTSKQAYLVVLVDGEEDPTKGTTIVLDQAEEEIVLATGLSEGFHTVKVLKRSEASDSNTALKQLSTDGYFSEPQPEKTYKLQFIAASSSTGYGNLGSISEAKTTANSHGLLGFAYLTGYLLDAEVNIFSASGWGVSRGWNTGGAISETQNIPVAYEYYAIDATNMVVTTPGKWDHSNYIPDVVVVNLGTNDFNASGYSSMTPDNKAIVEARFIQDYASFLIKLNNFYPNAIIIVAYGLMNEALTVGPLTLDAINQANTTIGHEVVHPFIMEAAGTSPNAYGSNYHPNVGTSKNVAEDLAAFINELTGREIVRPMIEGSN